MLTKDDKLGVGLLVGTFLTIVAIGLVYVGFRPPKAGPDGCLSPVVAESAIVIDHSEAMTDQTRQEIVARVLKHVQDKVQTNERVSVFYVSELSRRHLKPAFSRCKPQQEGNRLTQSVKAVEKGYQKGFLQPLTDAVSLPAPDGKESPIAQALIDVSLSANLRSPRNSLLVFSDMLEHTNKFSLLSCVNSQAAVAAFRTSRKGSQERPKFSNTSVTLNIVPRQNVSAATLQCSEKVWAWFFGDNDGKDASLSKDFLPG